MAASESYEFWAAFLRQLVERGLRGVQPVASCAHEGLRKLPRHAQGPVVALVRTIFAQPDLEVARRQLG